MALVVKDDGRLSSRAVVALDDILQFCTAREIAGMMNFSEAA